MSEKLALAFHVSNVPYEVKFLYTKDKRLSAKLTSDEEDSVILVTDELRKSKELLQKGTVTAFMEAYSSYSNGCVLQEQINKIEAILSEQKDLTPEKIEEYKEAIAARRAQYDESVKSIGDWITENLSEDQAHHLAVNQLAYRHLDFFGAGMIRLPKDLYKSAKPELMPRSQIEKTGDVLQYIPYVMLVDKHTGRVLEYTRAKGGDESRLHDMKSVGLGGHVDAITTVHGESSVDANVVEFDLKATLIDCVAKELLEEVGYHITGKDIEKLMEQLSEENVGVIRTKFSRLGIYDSSNEVGRSHIGVCLVLEVEPNDVAFVPNENRPVDPSIQNAVEILEPEWKVPAEIFDAVFQKKYDLEPWSRSMLRGMFVMDYVKAMSKTPEAVPAG